MTYIYHIVPQNLAGSVLYPLNEMRNSLPEVYAAQIKKYDARQALLDQVIPLLNCLWNDVLHFSPVHPIKFRDAQLEAGFETKSMRWFEIDPRASGFNRDNTVIFLYPPRHKKGFTIEGEDFEPYSYDRLPQLTKMPQATVAYFKEAKAEGKRPLLFHCVPHILFQGTVATGSLRVIEV